MKGHCVAGPSTKRLGEKRREGAKGREEVGGEGTPQKMKSQHHQLLVDILNI